MNRICILLFVCVESTVLPAFSAGESGSLPAEPVKRTAGATASRVGIGWAYASKPFPRITSVSFGSVADKQGLKQGDFLLSINGTSTELLSDLDIVRLLSGVPRVVPVVTVKQEDGDDVKHLSRPLDTRESGRRHRNGTDNRTLSPLPYRMRFQSEGQPTLIELVGNRSPQDENRRKMLVRLARADFNRYVTQYRVTDNNVAARLKIWTMDMAEIGKSTRFESNDRSGFPLYFFIPDGSDWTGGNMDVLRSPFEDYEFKARLFRLFKRFDEKVNYDRELEVNKPDGTAESGASRSAPR